MLKTRVVSCAVLSTMALLLSSTPIFAATYLIQGRLEILDDFGLEAILGLDGAMLSYSIDFDPAEQPDSYDIEVDLLGNVISRYDVSGFSIELSGSEGGVSDFVASVGPGLTQFLSTQNAPGGADSLRIPGVFSSSIPKIAGTVLAFPYLTATLEGEFTRVTSVGGISGVALLPDALELLNVDLSDVGQLRATLFSDPPISNSYAWRNVSLQIVPEPTSAILVGGGLAWLAEVLLGWPGWRGLGVDAAHRHPGLQCDPAKTRLRNEQSMRSHQSMWIVRPIRRGLLAEN